MKVKEYKIKKSLSREIQRLNDVVADLDSLVTEMGSDFYRVVIFRSARIQKDTKENQDVQNLAKNIATLGAEIVTGGRPGLMEAANAGAKEGSKKTKSIGVRIELPFESEANSHLDVKFSHKRFSSRLDEFMRISNAVVITPGGIGTLLELFFAWQLIQVEHIKPKPMILVGNMWKGLIQWIQENPLRKNLLDQKDIDKLQIVEKMDDVIPILEKEINNFYNKKQ
jgi:uncharacterized protein (TIGR00730 family)